MKRLFVAVSSTTLLLVLIACASPRATGPTSVHASLKEFSITLSQASVPTGQVDFQITNAGTVAHQFVVVKTDTPAASLPVEGGTVSADALTVVDEMEDIAAAANPTLVVDLVAGHYAIICNIEGHYAAGMHADLTVS